MNVLIKSLDIKKVVLYFCFLTIAFFSNVSYGKDGANQNSDRRKIKAAPTVINTIPNQTAHYGQQFNMDILTHTIFSDADNDDLTLTIKKADGSDLPAWLIAEENLPPTLVGSFDTADSAQNLVVVGNYAYVADEDSGLQIINISIPSSPSLVGTYSTPGCAWDVVVVNNYAYVADDDALQIINISTPSNPILAGSLDTTGVARRIAVAGNYAYVADWSGGLKIIDITNPGTPTLVGSFTMSHALEVAVAGNYAYIEDGAATLKIIDISDPASPTSVGSLDTTGEVHEIAVVGNYAYIADYTEGLKIIDITTPSSPTLIGALDTTGTAEGVVVVGNYAYVADLGEGLKIIDITNPVSPALVGALDTTGNARGVAVLEDYAYVADGRAGGLKIIKGIKAAGLTLSGIPSSSDVGTLNLKVTASDGVNEISTTFSIDVQNEGPTISDISKIGAEDTGIAFSAADFTSHFSDADGNSLARIRIVSLPSSGTLKLFGVNVVAGQEIDIGDLSGLTFIPNADWYGNTNFSWKGSDGVEYSADPADVNLSVWDIPPSNVPMADDILKTGIEGKTLEFTKTDFTDNFHDVGGTALIQIQIMSLPDYGALKLLGVPVAIDQEVNVGEIGDLTFVPEFDWNGKVNFGWKGFGGLDYSNTGSVIIEINKPKSSSTLPEWFWGGVVAPAIVACVTIPCAVLSAVLVKKAKICCFKQDGNSDRASITNNINSGGGAVNVEFKNF